MALNPIFIHNTLTDTKEEFVPIVSGKVGMYHCGPTVYDTAHIGNLRTFVMNDLIRRVFEYRGYFVTQVMNITDVDDKTIRRARDEGTTLVELTRRYEQLFLQDLQSLNILIPHRVLRAREHVKEMIEMISILLEHGFAYPSRDGIYFSIGKSAHYGALAQLPQGSGVGSTADAMLRERIANDEYEKENPRDFALWKFSTPEDGPDDGGAVWEAPFGKGRPGWHIECSAMATFALGPTIDIHTGGTDLIFPHHTNEIAQSEATTGKLFAHYWIHGAFMNVNDAKMAKSKGNFFKLADLEAELISPLGFRYWLMTAHYRSQVNFTVEAVRAAQQAFIRLIQVFMTWSSDGKIAHSYAERFSTYVGDDFDMPKAIALTWELVKDKTITDADKRATLLSFDRIFGLGFDTLTDAVLTTMGAGQAAETIPEEVIALAEVREEARKAKEWEKADALRKEIEERGYQVKDTQDNEKGFIVTEA